MKDQRILLCEVDGCLVYLLLETDAVTRMSKGVRIFLVDKKTGIPCMGIYEQGLKLKKKEILATNERLEQLYGFDLPFEADHLKTALITAQGALLNPKKTSYSYQNQSIAAIYKRVMRLAFQRLEEVDKDGVLLIQRNENALWFQEEILQEFLDTTGFNKSCTIFCKKLVELGKAMNRPIVTSNRENGYKSRTSVHKISKRHYRIEVVSELLKG